MGVGRGGAGWVCVGCVVGGGVFGGIRDCCYYYCFVIVITMTLRLSKGRRGETRRYRNGASRLYTCEAGDELVGGSAG